MSDRRRGGSGPGTPLRRAVGACGAVTTFLALGLCSVAGAPAGHADLEDLLDPIITAATTGLDQAGAAASVFSPDDLLAGATDFGSFADPTGQIDQLVQNFSTQLDDQLRGLGADWPDNLLTGSFGEPDGHALTELPGSAAAGDGTGTGSFLFGDGGTDGSHAAAAADGAAATDVGHADTASGATASDATGTVSGATASDATGSSGTEGGPTSGTGTGSGHADSAAGTNGDNNANSANNSNSPSMPRLSMPSSGGGGNGGGGNGGSGSGNGRAKPTTGATPPLAGQ